MRIAKNSVVMVSILAGVLLIAEGMLILLFIILPNERIGIAIMMAVSASGLAVIFVQRKAVYSRVSFNKDGVTNVCFCSRDIFLSWDECKEIGVFNQALGYGIGYQCCIYFLKEPVSASKKELAERIRVPNKGALRVQYSDAAMALVQSYIGYDRVKERRFN